MPGDRTRPAKHPLRGQETAPLVIQRPPAPADYEPDLIYFDKIVVELKAVSALTDEHRAQVINYLNASGLEVALLVNFGHYPRLEYERLANTLKKVPPQK